MIELPRPPFDFDNPRIKVFGIGGAGCNALDRIILDGLPEADLVAINTDAQALTASVASTKVQIGQTITRGLGAGGDPEIGRVAAEEGIGEILGALADATMVFLVVGLGGGTGSGAAPVISEVTREHNAMVVVIATMPFAFEGKRRAAQAAEALAALRRTADVLICFENDTMGEAVSPTASIQEAFAAADATISQCVRALAAMAGRRGLVHAGFDEIASAVRGEHVRSLFGYGEAAGDNRAYEALDLALRNPLLDRGRRLKETRSAVVQVAGGPDLTLNEVKILMEEVHRHFPEEAELYVGMAVDEKLSHRLSVTVLGSVPLQDGMEIVAPALRREPRGAALPVAAEPEPVHEDEYLDDSAVDDIMESPEPEPVVSEHYDEPEAPEPPPVVRTPISEGMPLRKPLPTPGPPRRPLFAPMNRERQPFPAPATPPPAVEPAPAPIRDEKPESPAFESVNRGRFEKSEPTIVDGQDLDVPTFLRRNSRPK